MSIQDKQVSLLETFVEFKDSHSTVSRVKLAEQICGQYTDKAFNEKERQIVNEIISILSQDVEKAIRQSIAENLKNSDELPHDIAMRLAQDEDEVSTPILQHSKVLTDMDLQMIVRSTMKVAKLQAVANRSHVSEVISAELVNKNQQTVTDTLLSNQGAAIDEGTLAQIAEQFEKSEATMSMLVARGGLSVGLVERLISVVSEDLRQKISTKYNIDPEVVRRKVEAARENATLNIVAQSPAGRNSIELVNHLHSSGKLTHSIVLRSLCRGDISFFEGGLARLAGIPITNASRLLQAGEKGFFALFEAASMPDVVRDATHRLLELVYDLRDDGLMDRSDFTAMAPHYLMERIIDKGYDQSVQNMGYMMALITTIADEHDRSKKA